MGYIPSRIPRSVAMGSCPAKDLPPLGRKIDGINRRLVQTVHKSCHFHAQVLQEAENGVEQYMESLIGKDRPDKDAEAVILTKYIVSPDRGLDFIKAFKLVSLRKIPLHKLLYMLEVSCTVY